LHYKSNLCAIEDEEKIFKNINVLKGDAKIVQVEISNKNVAIKFIINNLVI